LRTGSGSGFSSDGEYIDVSNDVLNEQEKDEWCFLKQSDVEFDEYGSCDASVNVCELQNVDQVMQNHLTCEDDAGGGGGGGLIENIVSFF
jgi:hypothetical protein